MHILGNIKAAYKKEEIKNVVANNFGTLCGLFSNVLLEDYVGNSDETLFSMSMDNDRKLKLWG